MTRDEAIEAGVSGLLDVLCPSGVDGSPCPFDGDDDACIERHTWVDWVVNGEFRRISGNPRVIAAAVLDAIGWEPS